jgi:uncharacterized protein YqeY
MSLKAKISEDLKSAMKSKDKIRLETIRSIRALILEHEKSGGDIEIKPEDEINMLTSAAKKRKEAIEQFEKGGRKELAEKEKRELEIIQEYMPKQLSEEELAGKIKDLAIELGANSKADFSKLMPAAIKLFKGHADGKVIKNTVDKVLEGN